MMVATANLWLVLLVALTAASPRAVPDAKRCGVKSRSLCEIVSKASKYDKKVVVARGLYAVSPEGGFLMGATCEVFVSYSKKLDKPTDPKVQAALESALHTSNVVPVVVRGVFSVAPPMGCKPLGAGCVPYGLEVHEFLCAGE